MSKPLNPKPKSIELHRGDLPDGLDFGDVIAADTETQGLNPIRDRLCVAQLSKGDGVCHLVQFAEDMYDAPNLKAVLTNPDVTKIFHYARFDIAILKRYLGVTVAPIYCTKIASKLTRTYTDRHGLKDVTRELLGVELSKEQQLTDWAAAELTSEQLEYAACDVLHLHQLRNRFEIMLEREGRAELARACFEFLAIRAELDLSGWDEGDIFAH